eukprot:g2611.t1
MTSEKQCPLPYPKRFEAAVEFVSSPHLKAKSIPDDLRLLFFALHKQATEGPCHQPRPWSWNLVETAKWESWHKLGNMTKMDAMRHYVDQLDKHESDWLTKLPSKGNDDDISQDEKLLDGSVQLSEQDRINENAKSLVEKLEEATAAGSWATPYLANASKPIARYEHGVALINDQLYIIGGNCTGGKYLNDIWRFDLASLSWMNLAPSNLDDSLLPPIAGHTVVPWRGSLLVLGGHVKSKDVSEKMPIRSLDLQSMKWSEVSVTGEIPVSRGGHSATLLGSKVYIFGGEDRARRPLSDLHVLDLTTLVWKQITTSQNRLPTPRSAHVGASYLNRYILYFGGGSAATCFNDLIVFDTQRQKWHVLKVTGRKPSPRAGHSAAVLRNHWYIVGGGNNAAGCTDMAYLDLTQLNTWPPLMESDDMTEDSDHQGPDLDELEYELSWTIVGTIPERSYLASEGMSLAALNEAEVLVCFGGYNGRYSNAISLFRPAEEAPLPKQLSYGSEHSSHLQTDKDNENDAQAASTEVTDEDKIEALKERIIAATKSAAAEKETTGNEMAVLRRQLNSAHMTLQEKEAELTQTQQQLTETETKKEKLEAELAEVNGKLMKMEELEKELEVYRRQKQQVSDGKTGGVWGWVVGE